MNNNEIQSFDSKPIQSVEECCHTNQEPTEDPDLVRQWDQLAPPWWKAPATIFSFFWYVSNFVTDNMVLYGYYQEAKYLAFGLQIGILVFSSVVSLIGITIQRKMDTLISPFLEEYHIYPILLVLSFFGLGTVYPLAYLLNTMDFLWKYYTNRKVFDTMSWVGYALFLESFDFLADVVELSVQVLPQFLVQTYILTKEYNHFEELYQRKIEVLSICFLLGTICFSMKKVTKRETAAHRWHNIFPGIVTQFVWIYCTTLARLISLVLLINFSLPYFVLFSLTNYIFYFCCYAKQLINSGIKDISPILFSIGVVSLTAIINYPMPLQCNFADDKYFFLFHMKTAIENFAIIVICEHYWSEEHWLKDVSLQSVLVLYCIGITVLLVTPPLRYLTKLCVNIGINLFYCVFATKHMKGLIVSV